ncbi:ComEC/Rec2 family competence protein [uncultured Sanguibacteroides sp.]|uniref:ComEC/Rec2 family competence protein n=1 Tax=uncultured Sanguibacteroides sp. TaxID=1635151 RepID=UPI0025CC8469|nr:ComEC/Rec2 family competence protein [uncultured Sanguibacteroides sp.]
MFALSKHKYPFILLSLPVVAGILWSNHMTTFTPQEYVIGILFSLSSIVFTFLFSRNFLFQNLSLALFLFLLAAYRNHSPEIPIPRTGKDYAITGEYIGQSSPGHYIIKNKKLCIRLQVNDSLLPEIGDYLSFRARLFPLSSRSNINEFNYNSYLRQQGIHVQGIALSPLIPVKHRYSIWGISQRIRNILLEKLDRTVKDTTTRSLLQALCLGYKYNISPDYRKVFQSTGTIHLLAISGLHMGAIYLLLTSVLSVFHLKKGVWLLIPLLWLFAFVSGLSPSACRAASILSFITISKLLHKDHVPLNAIGASAFFTLLIKPILLYSVSFQMSYAAYTGIVLLYPVFRARSTHWPIIIRKIYSLCCLSLAAQIAILPLTAYYFHYLTLNSVIINIVAIPLATSLLYGGILLLALPDCIGLLLSPFIMGIERSLLFLLRTFDRFTLVQDNLYPTPIQLVLIYLLILSFLVYLKKRTPYIRHIIYFTFVFLLLFCVISRYDKQNNQEIVIYHRHNSSMILLNYKGYYTFLKNTHPFSQNLPYIEANRLKAIPPHHGFVTTQIQHTRNQLVSPVVSLYIADTSTRSIPPTDYLVITGNIFPGQLSCQSESKLKKIILDGSNYSSSIEVWRIWAKEKGIPLQATAENGSLQLKLK